MRSCWLSHEFGVYTLVIDEGNIWAAGFSIK